MSRRIKRVNLFKQLLMLVVIPTAITGTGYALFSQKLTLTNATTKPLYSSSQGIYAQFNKSEAVQGSNTLYNFNPVTITNRGSSAVTDWQLKFDAPTDMSQLTCPTTVTCTQSGATVTVKSGVSNGSVAVGGSTTFTLSFVSAVSHYTLQNIYISGTVPSVMQPMDNLTFTATPGTKGKSGPNSVYPFTFVVDNKTGQDLSAWQASCNWSATPTTSGVPTTVNYTTTATSITFTSKTALANGASISFGATFTIRNGNWPLTGCAVQGKV